MEEIGHILKTLKEVKKALNNKDYLKIKNLSNKFIHNSSIHQDPDVISLAVIIYSLSKLVERESYKEYKDWNIFYEEYIKGIDNMISCLKHDNIDKLREEVEKTRNLIEKYSGKLKLYIREVFRKAEINRASRIYEHGISMEKTAQILGISIWELAEYAGKTGIGDVNLSVTLPIKQRIKYAEDIFKK